MEKYIGADKICKLLQKQADSVYPNTIKYGMCVTQKDVEQKTAILDLIDLIKEQATDDAIEVIRCGQCRHYNYLGDQRCALSGFVLLQPDDYCSFAENLYME